jgi:hypothetical protein
MKTSQTLLHQFRLRRGLVFGVIIVTALFAFEIFNYSTTDFALSDLLGDLKFMGIRWATILAIAFCGIDFAGIARLFTPSQDPGRSQPAQNETWYLFGAWLLAATMNAMLTWWGVSLAVLGHQTLGNAVVSRENLLRIVPIFVAVLVWLIRVLIIGTFSVAGDRLFSQDDQRTSSQMRSPIKVSTSQVTSNALAPRPSTASRAPVASSSTFRSAGRGNTTSQEAGYTNRPEPTYHSVSASPSANANGSATNGQSGTSRSTFNRGGQHRR